MADIQDLASAVKSGDRVALPRAITLVESTANSDRFHADYCWLLPPISRRATDTLAIVSSAGQAHAFGTRAIAELDRKVNRHACRPSPPSSTRAIVEHVNVSTIGLIDRLVANRRHHNDRCYSTAIARRPVGDGFWRWAERGIRYQRVESMARALST